MLSRRSSSGEKARGGGEGDDDDDDDATGGGGPWNTTQAPYEANELRRVRSVQMAKPAAWMGWTKPSRRISPWWKAGHAELNAKAPSSKRSAENWPR